MTDAEKLVAAIAMINNSILALTKVNCKNSEQGESIDRLIEESKEAFCRILKDEVEV